MNLLLDTHTMLWAALTPKMLSSRVAELIENETNTLLVSAVSAWEIATKVRIGKLPGAEELECNFLDLMGQAGYTLLGIDAAVALRAGRMPGPHKDPFDQMLAAQALASEIPILSMDTVFDSFAVRRIW